MEQASKKDESLDSTDASISVDGISKKFRRVKFYAIQSTAKGKAQVLSTKKCSRSTPCPSTLQQRDDLSHPDHPFAFEMERFLPEQAQQGYKVNVLEGYNDTSTQAVLKAVEVNGKHTLSLDGEIIEGDDTVFKEYTQVKTDEHGAPKTDELGVYFFECCKFPGYFIHWNCDRSVDCECKASTTDPHYFKWEKKPVPVDSKDTKLCLQYSWLVAHGSNPPLVSLACLTFREPDDQPTIQSVNPTKFLISYEPTS